MAILTGTTTINEIEQSLSIPIFIHINQAKENCYVEYTPFAFRVNPKEGGTSVSPNIKKTDGTTVASTFAMDYKRSFNYFIWDGKNSITDDPQETGILKQLWGNANPKSAKGPMAYFTGNGTTPLSPEKLANQIGYVNNSTNAKYAVEIAKDKWKDNSGEFLHGFVRGQMIFQEVPTNEFNASTNQVFPLMIWLDPNYYPVTE